VTADEEAALIAERAANQSATLADIAASTEEQLAQVAITYATDIKASSSFGYIAGGFLAFLFIFPTLMDLHKAYINFVEKQEKLQKRNNNRNDESDEDDSDSDDEDDDATNV
jgi:hypothetical protein